MAARSDGVRSPESAHPPTHPAGRSLPPIGCCALNGTAIAFGGALLVLAVLVGTWFYIRRQESRRSACLARLAGLDLDLRLYKDDFGFHPPATNAAAMAALLAPRFGDPDPETALDLSSNGEILDPWGRPLVFRTLPAGTNAEALTFRTYATAAGGVPYRIYSVGPDGEDDLGEDDDVWLPRSR